METMLNDNKITKKSQWNVYGITWELPETYSVKATLGRQRVCYQGHPTSIFEKYLLKKTIGDLEFSEHLL